MSAIERARTLLFVPGTRPDRFDKALAAGASVSVLDLEDAVAPAEKEQARAAVVAWLTRLDDEQRTQIAVRVNAAGTPWHGADLAAVSGRVGAVMVPKAEAGGPLCAAAASSPVIALVETGNGILDVREIARTQGVVRLAFGSFDLAAELGIDPLDGEALLASRSALVLASAAAGLPGPIDGVHAAVDDGPGLRAEAETARRLGFSGKLCIHPRQVATVEAVLRPSSAEVAWAERILAVAPADGVATVDGRMVDKPVIERARRIAAAVPKESR